MSPPNDLSESPVAKEYARRRDEYRVQLTALDRQGLLLANARLLTFAAFVVTLGLTWAGKIPEWGFWISGLSFLLFVVAAVTHDRILKREERTRILVEINARGLARLDGTWTEFTSRGDRFLEKGHAYANDLNIFGKASLFQLLDTTGTRLGEETLGGWLSKQSEIGRIQERHAAVAELAPMLDFREGVETEGKLVSKTKADSTKLLAWAESTPLLRHKKYFHALAFIFPPITCGLYVAGKLGLVNEATWYLPLVVQLAVVVATRDASMRVFEQVSSPGERFIRFEGMFALLEQVKW